MCLPSRLGTNLHAKETGIVATKQRRKRRTATETPIEAAMELMSNDSMVVCEVVTVSGFESLIDRLVVVVRSCGVWFCSIFNC